MKPWDRTARAELAAWRFLARRRCPGLHAAHIEFVDGPGPTLATPADEPGVYESQTGKTFGEAAIALALRLGMRPRLRGMLDESLLKPGLKLCTYCAPPQWREREDFTASRTGVGGLDNRCNHCRARRRREQRKVRSA